MKVVTDVMGKLADQLYEKVKLLEFPLQQAFCLDCAFRACRKYVIWSKLEGAGWAKPEVLYQAIDEAWHILEEQTSIEPLLVLRQQLISVIPDTEQFREASQYGALDASCCVGYAINTVISPDRPNNIYFAILCALYAADLSPEIVQESNNMISFEWELANAFRASDVDSELGNEIALQKRTIEVLSHWEKPLTRSNLTAALDLQLRLFD
jgi:hypothetical protein